MIDFCDQDCIYAKWDEAGDYGKACRCMVGIYCEKKGMVIPKNMPCIERVEREK